VKLDKLVVDLCPIQYAPIDVETKDPFPKKEKQVSWSACTRRKLCNRESETTVTQKDELQHMGG